VIEYDVIVIGAGIAGMTASIYLKRENLNVLIIEKEMPGGQMVKTPIIENYPGFNKIEGSSLALNIYNQVTALGIEVNFEEVLEIEDKKEIKIIKTRKKEYKAKKVIIATGRTPKTLGLLNEQKLIGKGISNCATCDGAFYKNKEIGVVGGGNSSITESLFLSNIVKDLTLVHRNENFRSEKTLLEKLKSKKNVTIKTGVEIKDLKEENEKLIIFLTNNETLKVDGLFVFIGYEPKLEFINKLDININNGYLVVSEEMQTSIDGIYAVGDIIDKEVYQLTTASAEAAIAAHSIKKDLLLK
jgi:Thioredoxin reductase